MAARSGRARGKRGGRRFFVFTVVALLTLSLGFVLGVLAGQKWTRGRPLPTSSEPARKSPPAARRALSDAEAVKPPQIQEKLTFYQTLTAPLASTPPPARAEAPKPEATPREEGGRERPKAAAEAPVGAAREGPVPAAERGYTVQVSAYRVRPAAEEMEKKLRDAGFEAYVATLDGEDGRATYRVRVGSFATRAEALRMAERLRSERGFSPFVASR